MSLIKLIISILLCPLASSLVFSADEYTDKPILITQEMGTEIDVDERNKYGMFLSVKNFESAVLRQTQEGTYIFIVKYYDEQMQSSTTREIEITEEELEQIRSKIDYRNTIEETDSIDTQPARGFRVQTEFVISRAFLITKDYDNDVASRELFFSLERYYTALGVGINLLTTYYVPILSANLCAAYPRDFPITPYLSCGFSVYPLLLLNYSAGLKLSLHQHVAIRLEYRTWYELEGTEIFESFYTGGLNITF